VPALSGSQVEPAAFDVNSDGRQHSLLLRVATSPAATDAQIAAARALVSGDATVVTGDAEAALWDTQVKAPWTGEAAASPERAQRVEAVVRFSWLPASLLDVLRLVGELTAAGTPAWLTARAMGTGFLRLEGEAPAQAAAITRLRASASVGNVAVLRASAAVKAAVDVWGTRPSDAVARAIKGMFDPAGVLNAGRGPV
jgi:hypothetical protein